MMVACFAVAFAKKLWLLKGLLPVIFVFFDVTH
jgi:hypothetical protein